VEEILAVVIIVLPGILAIHDYGHNMRTFSALQTLVDRVQRIDHILRGSLTSHTGIVETNLVRNNPVAEKDPNLFAGFTLYIVWTVECVGVFYHTVAIPGKAISIKSQACHKNRFAGLHPLVAGFTDERHNIFCHRPLTRP